MATPVIVVGHKNPDNDSIAAAVGYAYLKNEIMKRELEKNPDQEVFEYIPARLGPLPEESASILEQYNVAAPEVIAHIHTRVQDVMSSPVISISKNATLVEAGRLLNKYDVRALVVTEDDGTYCGLITTRKIAERYIASTDSKDIDDKDTLAIANDLVESLSQKVEEFTENNGAQVNARYVL